MQQIVARVYLVVWIFVADIFFFNNDFVAHSRISCRGSSWIGLCIFAKSQLLVNRYFPFEHKIPFRHTRYFAPAYATDDFLFLQGFNHLWLFQPHTQRG